VSILARIRANGGDVIRDEWRFRLLPGRLKPDAISWIRANWQTVCNEVWPAYWFWLEQAAFMEFGGPCPRAEAERRAYAEVCRC